MLAAPELVVPEMVEVGGELEVALELQRRVLTQRVVWCKKSAEPHLLRLEIMPPAIPAPAIDVISPVGREMGRMRPFRCPQANRSGNDWRRTLS